MPNRRSYLFLALTSFAGLMAAAPNAYASTTHCFDFESATGSYNVGDIVTTAAAEIRLARFQWGSGTWTSAGVATIVNSNLAAGSASHELNLNNINARVFPDPVANYAEYYYADLGGNINFGVNYDFRNHANLTELDGTVVGGCDISVTEVAIPAGVRGVVEIDCPGGVDLEVFGVGGQEFYIDDVCFDH